ncbi:MAG: GDCCVxC domain-containing (seleno)protein [Rhodoferax sp.]
MPTIICPCHGPVFGQRQHTDACQWFYDCEQCRAVLKPKRCDCYVFCSYGTVRCPPIQETGKSDICCG